MLNIATPKPGLGPFPGRKRLGLIEAGPALTFRRRSKAPFPGGNAWASLKRVGQRLAEAAADAFPGRKRLDLIEAHDTGNSGPRNTSPFPGGNAGASLKLALILGKPLLAAAFHGRNAQA